MFKKNICTKLSIASITNDTGPVEVGNPYPLFSPIPVMGSILTIHCNSFFLNKLTNISIQIFWDEQSLPDNFKVYYSGYHILPPYGNKSFLVNIVLIENHTQYLLNQQPLSLFAEKEAKVFAKSIFSFNVKEMIKQQCNQKMARFLKKITGSCIRLILVAPETAFGHTLYAGEVTRAALEMLKDSNHTLPMPPYIPRVNALEVVVA